MTEFDKGIFEWAQPIDPDALPEGATLTRRFGVVQKDTVRPIDDYRASLLNASVTQAEAVSIHGVDHIVPCALNICTNPVLGPRSRSWWQSAGTWPQHISRCPCQTSWALT